MCAHIQSFYGHFVNRLWILYNLVLNCRPNWTEVYYMSNLNSNCLPPSPSSCDVKSSKSSVTEVSVKFDHFNGRIIENFPHTGKNPRWWCG